MPTFSGDITITYIAPIDENGNLPDPLPAGFTGVDSTVNQVLLGTTTLYAARIIIEIFDEGRAPIRTYMLMMSDERTPNRIPQVEEKPLYSDSLLSGSAANGAVNWSVQIPAGTLQRNKKYTAVAHDSDDLVSTSQKIETAP